MRITPKLLRSSKICPEHMKFYKTLRRDRCTISMERRVSNREVVPAV
jgi:hypothetical protein